MVSRGKRFSADASLEIIIVYTPWGVLQCLKTNYSLKQHIKLLSASFPKWNQWLLLNLFTHPVQLASLIAFSFCK